jgi:hypothetical protein
MKSSVGLSDKPEFLSDLLSAMDEHPRCVPKGRDFDNPRRQPGARRPIKPLIAPTGRYLRGIMEKTFVDPYTLFFQQTSVFGYEIGLFVMFPLILDVLAIISLSRQA